MALGTTRLYLSVFMQERETAAGTDSPQSKKREVQDGRLGIVDEKRERVKVKSSKNDEIFIM